MDLVSDSLADGRSFRALAIVDHFTRECPVIEVDLSLPGARVLHVLEQLAEERGLPDALRVDHGPEFVCDAVRTWCEKKNVQLDYIERKTHAERARGKFQREVSRRVPEYVLVHYAATGPQHHRELESRLQQIFNPIAH